MPIIRIEITREGATAAQKTALIHGATALVADVLGKDPTLTFVVIEEVDTGNWGVAGESVAAQRARHSAEMD
jgi:4-oxalocrotonate tautomerase